MSIGLTCGHLSRGVCAKCAEQTRGFALQRAQETASAIADVEYESGIVAGRRLERADVVAWLREQASTMRGVMFAWRDGLEWAAARIEAREHKETSQKTNKDRCPYPGCTGVKDHVECTKCGEEHCLGCFE